jgi:hypothetical protein
MKISDKLAKVDESYTINMYDNGYLIDVGGEDANGDWKSAKILVSDIASLVKLVEEASTLERR